MTKISVPANRTSVSSTKSLSSSLSEHLYELLVDETTLAEYRNTAIHAVLTHLGHNIAPAAAIKELKANAVTNAAFRAFISDVENESVYPKVSPKLTMSERYEWIINYVDLKFKADIGDKVAAAILRELE